MVTFFAMFVLICGVGLGFVGWLLLRDSTKPSLEDRGSLSSLQRPKEISVQSAPIENKWNAFLKKGRVLLNKFSFAKKKQGTEGKLSSDLLFKQPAAAVPEAIPALKLTPGVSLSKDEEKHIEEEIDLTLQFHELKEKYERLDSLFKEKSSELEKAQRSLETELRTRKEFNKVKDILEKELKDVKDRTHNLQIELISAKTEAEGYQKRINQLETKVTQLEKEILQKEEAMEELLKKQAKIESPKTIQPQAVSPAPSHIPNPPTETSAGTKSVETPPHPPIEKTSEETIDKDKKGEDNV